MTPASSRTGGLAFGIPAQTGARAFNAEVAEHLRIFRDLIEKGEACVARFFHMGACPTDLGLQPLTTYQIAFQKTASVTNLTIKGKHEFLPGSHLAEVAAAKTPRRRNASEGKLAKKRRLQAIREEGEGSAGSGSGHQQQQQQQQQQAGEAQADDSGFDADASGEYDGQHGYEEYEREQEQQDYVRSIKKHCTPHARAASEAPYEEGGYEVAHDDGYVGYEGDESMNSIVVNLHPPTPRKPSKPSSRRPGPPRYSARLRSGSITPATYGLDDLREPYPSIPPSTAAPSEYYYEDGDETSSIAAGSEATTRTNMTVTQATTPMPAGGCHQGSRRRSSRLASLPPGTLEQDPVLDAAYQLDGVALDANQSNSLEDISYEPIDDVDMLSSYGGGYSIAYSDPEEQRLALEQNAAEAARRERELRSLPGLPMDISGNFDGEAMRAWQAGLAASGAQIKSEPGIGL